MRVHWSLWIIGGLGLVWNLMGCMNFVMQMNPEAVASYPSSHRALIEDRPVWATAAVFVAVFGGALGCLMLFMKRRIAITLLVVSLIGTVVQLIPVIPLLGNSVKLSPFEIALVLIGPVVVGMLLLSFARRVLA